MADKTKPSGPDHQPQPGPEGQHTKTVQWSDLTEDQLALRDEMLKQGIHPTPEMILKIGSGEIKYYPPPKSLDDEIAAVHFLIETRDGRKYEVVEGRRIEVGLGRKNKANLDFPHLWDGRNISLAYCIPKKYLTFGEHGGVHFRPEPLQEHDVESVAANLIAYLYLDRPELPKQFKFRKSLRRKAKAAHSTLLAIASRNQVQTVTRQSPKGKLTG